MVICLELNLVVFPKNCISRFFNLSAAIAKIIGCDPNLPKNAASICKADLSSEMGYELYKASNKAKDLFNKANYILGFNICDIMFGDDDEALKQTNVTQPSIFIHSVILSEMLDYKFKPDVVAGHSLGEFSALVAAKYLSFEDGLRLVSRRAKAMQIACEKQPSSMAAIIGLEDMIVEKVCEKIDDIVVPANYNCNGQIVISGTNKGIDIACASWFILSRK